MAHYNELPKQIHRRCPVDLEPKWPDSGTCSCLSENCVFFPDMLRWHCVYHLPPYSSTTQIVLFESAVHPRSSWVCAALLGHSPSCPGKLGWIAISHLTLFQGGWEWQNRFIAGALSILSQNGPTVAPALVCQKTVFSFPTCYGGTVYTTSHPTARLLRSSFLSRPCIPGQAGSVLLCWVIHPAALENWAGSPSATSLPCAIPWHFEQLTIVPSPSVNW